MKHEKQICSIGGRDRIGISTLCLAENRKRYFKNLWKSSLVIPKYISPNLERNVRINTDYLPFGRSLLKKNFLQVIMLIANYI